MRIIVTPDHWIDMMSLFRSLASWLSRVWIRIIGSNRVVVLTYHSISSSTWRHAVSAETFRAQMAWLRRYATVIPLAEVERRCFTGAPRTHQPVVAITFDDGYHDAVTNAMPILKEFGFPATFFVTASLERVTSDVVSDVEPMTPADIQELAQAGFEIGAHGLTHQSLAEVSAEVCRHELSESRRKLQSMSGQSVQRMSYPKGKIDPERSTWIREAGYTMAVCGYGSVSRGTDVCQVPKIPVRQDITLRLFVERLHVATVLWWLPARFLR